MDFGTMLRGAGELASGRLQHGPSGWPPTIMPRYTILNIMQATIIVALSCTLARYVGRDLLSTFIVALSSSGLGIGLWCGAGRPASPPP